MLRKALKISSPLVLVSREVPRFHGGSLWHSHTGLKEACLEGRLYLDPNLLHLSYMMIYLTLQKPNLSNVFISEGNSQC